YVPGLLLVTYDTVPARTHLGSRTGVSLSDRHARPPRLRHIFFWADGRGVGASWPVDRRRTNEPNLVGCYRGTPKQSQSDVRPTIYFIYDKDAYDFHH